jgi:hypothetical protein
MTAETLAQKYITNTEKTLKETQWTKGPLTVTDESINQVKDYINAYLKDAKYFSEQKRFETSLTSIAYCEGLIDALKLIGAAKTKTQKNKETEEQK